MKIIKSLDSSELIELIKSGAIGVIPTDTVYGLVCLASNEESVNKIYKVKGRVNKPGTLIAANIDQLVDLGIKRRYLTAVEQFWPGPVSIEIPHQITYLNQGTGRQAMRVPKSQEIHELLIITGPLQTTSANLAGKETVKNIDEAVKIFGDKLDFYVDGGDLSDRKPSAIIRIIDDAIDVIRPGEGFIA